MSPSQAPAKIAATHTDDETVLETLKAFATDEGEVGGEAWNKLLSYPAGDLLRVLTRLQGKEDEDKILASYIAFFFCNLNVDYDANKQVIVDVFNSSLHNASQLERPIARLIRRGDDQLLSTLFAIAPRSDGDLSESLGATFGEQMREAPQQFLSKLSVQPKGVRDSIYRLIPLGLTDDDYHKVKSYLNAVTRRSSTSQVAQEMLTAISR